MMVRVDLGAFRFHRAKYPANLQGISEALIDQQRGTT
jgi:hypothetical protein